MNKLPFSAYDFFGYLSAGFLFLTALDYAFDDGGWIIHSKLVETLSFMTFFWIVLAYILGQIIANIAGDIIERRFVREILKAPEENLFAQRHTAWARLFPGYFEPLPEETRAFILKKAADNISTPGRALFFHCLSVAKRDAPTLDRLSTFLNAYGFCRNIAMACILSMFAIVIGAFRAGSDTARCLRKSSGGRLRPRSSLSECSSGISSFSTITPSKFLLRMQQCNKNNTYEVLRF